MPLAIEDLLREHDVFVPTDNAFQRRARLLQALWREERGLPIGTHRGRALGSRLTMPRAEESLENYLTETIRGCVRRVVLTADSGLGQLFGRPRIFNDLLSSQPLCFNLFAELEADRDLATKTFQRLLPVPVREVTAVRFEHSPGRRDQRFTSDNSAHDVFVEYVTETGRRGFVGIEVKYHENLRDKAAPHRPRYDEVADAMGVFAGDARSRLRASRLQQIWRDHLLAGSIVLARVGFDEGFFGFLHPEGNGNCVEAVEKYRACLSDRSTFLAWTLEEVVSTIRNAGAGTWVDELHRRYLDFARIEANGR